MVIWNHGYILYTTHCLVNRLFQISLAISELAMRQLRFDQK